jgi:hypothetical protein
MDKERRFDKIKKHLPTPLPSLSQHFSALAQVGRNNTLERQPKTEGPFREGKAGNGLKSL